MSDSNDRIANSHTHLFGNDATSRAERRTRWVVLLTFAMMIVEVAAGILTGSMSLLADGWHMATHAAALGIAVFAYAYARRHASDPRFTFGTGKVSSLGGYASAAALGVVGLSVLGESVVRLFAARPIRYDEAIWVAVIGLVVNLASLAALHDPAPQGAGRDHNFRGAYLHVLADALTSVLAIAALAAGKLWDWAWVDPAVGIVGSVLIGRWSIELLRETSRVLLDAEPLRNEREAIRQAIEARGTDQVTDLHVWRVGPAHLAVIVVVASQMPQAPEVYRARLTELPELAHVTVEVQDLGGPRSPRSS